MTGVDPNKNIFSGVLDAGLIGGFAGTGIGGTNIAAHVVGRTLATDEEVQQIQDNAKQQEVLIDKAETTDSNPVKQALLKRVHSLKFEANEIMDENYRLASKLSPEQKTRVAELYSVWNDLQSQIEDGKIPQEDIPTIESTIEGVKTEIQTIKEDLLAQEETEMKEAEKVSKEKAKETKTGEEEFVLGNKTFKSEKEFRTWLDKNYNERDRFSSVNEEGYLEPNTMRVFNKWYEENKKRLIEEDFSRQTAEAEKRQIAETSNITYRGTMNGLDSYAVENKEGNMADFSVKEGASQEEVARKRDEILQSFEPKPQIGGQENAEVPVEKKVLNDYLNIWSEDVLKNKDKFVKEIKEDFDMVLQKLKNLELIKTDCL
jgi:hypothetical protein